MDEKDKKIKAITQEDPMGCAIACVASVLGISYKKGKYLFARPEDAIEKGFYCPAIVKVLNGKGLNYSFSKVKKENKKLINQLGVIVFTDYLGGHYFVKTKKGWVDSWINFPNIAPAKSGFRRNILGKEKWVLYPKIK